ncbi:MAG: putative DNA modification/repair radical SAM protein [Anaerolineae bacterium]
MYFHTVPDTTEKLRLLGDVTAFEPAGDTPQRERLTLEARPQADPALLPCVTHVTTPTGLKPVMKSMITTACEKNCFYCPFRAGRSQTRRLTFSPDEMAAAFDQLVRAGVVDGIFLSSGIIRGGAAAQDRIIDTAEIIRRKYGYRGYVHLKIMPGAEYDQLERAIQVADRVSINLEAPTQERLAALAPRKEFGGELLERLQWAGRIRAALKARNPHRKVASVVTQFVVGAVGDTDLELLSLSDRLYHQLGLARAYYSPFSPVVHTPFEDRPATSPVRERRLYQASFLLRDYAWDVEDLPFSGEGNLDLHVDPKRAWADQHLRHDPVEIMRADRETLLRVPGIGPKGADRILAARRRGRIRDLAALHRIGVQANRAAPYILLNGQRPPRQLALFAVQD